MQKRIERQIATSLIESDLGARADSTEARERVKQKQNKKKKDPSQADIELIIRQEVEEFLRDLTLEYPFPEIFEILRRHEFRDRFGKNVTPLPQKRFQNDSLKEIQERIAKFLMDLRKNFGPKYKETIANSFRFYTETTLDDE